MLMRFLTIALGNLGRQALSVIAQLILAHRIGGAAFGLVTFGLSIYLVMAGFGDFGSRLYCWRTVAGLAREERSAAAHDLVWVRLFLALGMLIPINLGLSFVEDHQLQLVLRCYSIAIVFNQVAFDWWFLSQEKFGGLFIFNVTSGALMLVITVLFVHGPNDVAIFALALPISCGVPGIILTMLGRPLPRPKRLREALHLPLLTRRYVGYDWFQRIYQAFIPIVAWFFFDRSVVGNFRIAYLFYWFGGMLAIYAGSSIFNRLVANSGDAVETRRIMGTVTTMLVLIVLPLSGVAEALSGQFIDGILGPAYASAKFFLDILLPCLAIPVIANFLRESTMASGHTARATKSYVATVLLTTIVIAAFANYGVVILPVATIIGEAIGGIPLVIRLGHRFWRGELLWRLPAGLLAYVGIVALGQSRWLVVKSLAPYVSLALNGVLLTAAAGTAIGLTVLIEAWLHFRRAEPKATSLT